MPTRRFASAASSDLASVRIDSLAIRPVHLLLFVAVMMVWGANFVVAKIGLEEFPPIWLVTLRFAVVAVLLVWFVPPPHGKWWDIALISIVLGVLHFVLMFVGLTTLDAATAAITIQIQVPLAALLAAIVFGDRLGWRRALGLATAIAGVVVIAGEPRLEGQYLALAMVIAAAAMWSVSTILMKRMGPVHGLTVLAWMAVLSTPILALCSLVLEEGQVQAVANATAAGWLSIIYQSVVVVVLGYGTWYWLLRQYEVNQAMPFTLLIPPAGVISGVVFLGEALTWALVVGGLLTVAGVGIVLVRRPRLLHPGPKGP